MYKAFDIWLAPYLFRDRPPRVEGCTDIILAVCDHFEPFHKADKERALARVAQWKEGFPKLASAHRDAHGVGPRHSFFYPIEQYDAEVVECLAEVCAETGSETEVHLHHDGDTAEGLRERLERGKADLGRHGLLARDAEGRPVYGFIHGNWALDDSHPEGKHCGVCEELAVLKETGCYADFTMPSAPDPTQTRILNAVYYAKNGPTPKSHDAGVRVSARDGSTSGLRDRPDHLMLVQGPLGLNWRWRKWGLLPRVENADLTGANPPTRKRMQLWLECGVHVAGRPEWRFIKLHSHGAIPENAGMFLGEAMADFHAMLAREYNDGERFRLHYVTAREMVNMIHAAEDGCEGDAGRHRDYLYRKA